MRKTHAYLPTTTYALQVLGAQIAIARRELGWTASDLAGRLGVTAQLVSRIESGSPSTSAGTMLEAAVLCGIPLFDNDANDVQGMARIANHENLHLALLPSRTQHKNVQVPNDF
jgi:transcriptional regulator with XRE-family HTH domain